MNSDNPKVYALVDQDNKDYSFIKGNTKFLRDMEQSELAILFKNGDDRVKIEGVETETAPVRERKTPRPKTTTALETPAQESTEAEV